MTLTPQTLSFSEIRGIPVHIPCSASLCWSWLCNAKCERVIGGYEGGLHLAAVPFMEQDVLADSQGDGGLRHIQDVVCISVRVSGKDSFLENKHRFRFIQSKVQRFELHSFSTLKHTEGVFAVITTPFSHYKKKTSRWSCWEFPLTVTNRRLLNQSIWCSRRWTCVIKIQ